MLLNAKKKGSDKMIKTFRGNLADAAEDRIRLHTIQGKMGYKIVKFQIMQGEPGEQTVESTVKIYKSSQSTINNTVDFTDNDLLAVAYWELNANVVYPLSDAVIFDNEIVNQDIYVSHKGESADTCNYYIELEVVELSELGAEYTTIRDIRTQKQNP